MHMTIAHGHAQSQALPHLFRLSKHPSVSTSTPTRHHTVNSKQPGIKGAGDSSAFHTSPTSFILATEQRPSPPPPPPPPPSVSQCINGITHYLRLLDSIPVHQGILSAGSALGSFTSSQFPYAHVITNNPQFTQGNPRPPQYLPREVVSELLNRRSSSIFPRESSETFCPGPVSILSTPPGWGDSQFSAQLSPNPGHLVWLMGRKLFPIHHCPIESPIMVRSDGALYSPLLDNTSDGLEDDENAAEEDENGHGFLLPDSVERRFKFVGDLDGQDWVWDEIKKKAADLQEQGQQQQQQQQEQQEQQQK
ncbi:hypothetical protein B0O80DRAFT_504079 [Mortierella sp. GBAus27b]|nr:hypothetical protein B0O80DRAFT_504079 [Mortierella sp. GBAus27b]